MTALILHGVSGNAGKHWMQWLHDELVKLGIEVIMPTLPNSDNPDFFEWKKTILNLIKDVELSELIVFGHSLGNAAALEIVQDLDKPIKAFISVAGFYQDYGSEINTEYMQKCDIDIKKARERIENAFVVYGDNDPYVPQNVLNKLAVGLEVEPIVIKSGEHLNTDAGFTRLPVLIELAKKVCN